MRISHVFGTSKIWIFDVAFLFLISFGSIHHPRTFIPRQNCPCINMVYNGVDPNNNLGKFTHVKDFLTLTYPPISIFEWYHNFG